jgi:tRNA threonylcarbamoyladenosine biosynthesis protein TsaE
MESYSEDHIPTVADYVLSVIEASDTGATVIGLQGDLGAGKTTLTKAVAQKLGVAETVVSPTFVIAKFYEASNTFKQVVHIDAYRIEDVQELVPLGWDRMLQQPRTLIIVEWPERIKNALPSSAQQFIITHEGEKRSIKKI